VILRTKDSSTGFEVGQSFTVSIAIKMIREGEQGLKYSRGRETLASNLQALFRRSADWPSGVWAGFPV
jgi:hypothetical protein